MGVFEESKEIVERVRREGVRREEEGEEGEENDDDG